MKGKLLLVGGNGFVGSHVTNALRNAGFEICVPSHEELNLSFPCSIQEYLSDKSFEGLIYCAIDKNSFDIVETNLNNLKNLLAFKHHFLRWVHISSRSVYDALSICHDVLPIPINTLRQPCDNPYSILKYKEEQILHDEAPRNLIVLRVFDIAVRRDMSDIEDRWRQQINRKGFCRNEILSPIYMGDLCDAIVRIISNGCTGTYNLCGLQKIGSYDLLRENISECQVESQTSEHSGLRVLYDDINRQYLKDYYHCFDNRDIPLIICSSDCKVKGVINFSDGVEYLETGVLHLSSPSLELPAGHQSDISSLVIALSILPAYSAEVEYELLKLSEGYPIYLDAGKEDADYVAKKISGIHFVSGVNSKASFAEKSCRLVLSTKLSRRLVPFVFEGAEKVLVEEILEKILLKNFIPFLRKNNITPLFIDGPQLERLPVDAKNEPYLFQHASLEDVLCDKEYVNSFYRLDKNQIDYAYNERCGLLAGNAITSNGIHLMSAFFESDYLNVDSDGIRRSIECQSPNTTNKIWIFGSCLAFGLFATDNNTFPSDLQVIINSRGDEMQVVNLGVKGRNNVLNDLVFAMDTPMHRNDYIIFVDKFNETARKEISVEKMTLLDFSKYLCKAGMEPNSFLNSTFHANLEIYHHLADFVSQYISCHQTGLSTAVEPLLLVSKKKAEIDSAKLLDMAFLESYLDKIKKCKFNINKDSIVGSIVMAANPFTLGHAGIVDIISRECDYFYVFVIEDSDFNYSFDLRYDMVRKYCSKYTNCRVFPTGHFFGASFLFPEYHSKEEFKDKPIKPPFMDTLVYAKIISPLLGINRRSVGSENTDMITNQFNKYLEETLPLYGIELKIIDRVKDSTDVPISGTKVRQMLEENSSVEELLEYVPLTTLKSMSLA